jgi:fimbrial isopeptide formation D2 family protein
MNKTFKAIILFLISIHFIQAQPIPGAPNLLSPANNATIANLQPLFTWDITANAVHYEIVISRDSLFSVPLIIKMKYPAQFTDKRFFHTGRFYWRVRAYNSANIAGPWSKIFSFFNTKGPKLLSLDPDTGLLGSMPSVKLSGLHTGFRNVSYSIVGLWRGKENLVIDTQYIINDSTEIYEVQIGGLSSPGVYQLVISKPELWVEGTMRFYSAFTVIKPSEISGKIYLDNDSNCAYGPGDIPLSQRKLKLSPGPVYATTDDSGHYSFHVTPGTYIISEVPQLLQFFTQKCAPGGITVSINNVGQISTANDFADSPDPYIKNCPPLIAVDVAPNSLRRCLTNRYSIKYYNLSADPAQNVVIHFTPDTAVHILSASIPYTVLNGVYIFNVANISGGGSGTIHITDSIGCGPQIGDPICASVEVYPPIVCPGVDLANLQQSYTYCGIVVGSFDPNDKLLVGKTSQGGKYEANPGEALKYRINFQNTGTDTAFKVVVRDTLSSLLDLSTVESGASSHPYTFRIYDEGILEWTFNNILLADSFVNEEASHGFVTFSVKQNTGNVFGNTIKNTAGIYFDYNVPVITNTVLCDLTATVIPDISVPQSVIVSISPNPFTEQAILSIRGKISNDARLEITDILGKSMQHYTPDASGSCIIRHEQLPAGMYFYRLIDRNKILSSGKIIVQ